MNELRAQSQPDVCESQNAEGNDEPDQQIKVNCVDPRILFVASHVSPKYGFGSISSGSNFILKKGWKAKHK